MIPLFLTLSLVNLAGLAITAGLGYAVANGHDLSLAHQLAGVAATMSCCAVHCTVMTYFMATSKWVQHAVRTRRLSQSLAASTRSFRFQAFPAALGAIAIVCLAAFFGAARVGYGIPGIYHHVIALVALIANLAAGVIEYQAIVRNARLIDQILSIVNSKSRVVSTDQAKR